MLFNFLKLSPFLIGIILLVGLNSILYAQSTSSSNVKIIDVSDLKLILEEEKGDALLINVWATWCEPCREEFPDLVALTEQYKKNIRFISISVDDVADLDSKVIPFLKNQNAKFENYLLKVVEPENFINLLNKDWSGAIPATFVYDKFGKQTDARIGKQSFEVLENAIKKSIE